MSTMKKLLLAALFLSGFAFLAPSAEAASYRTVRVGYDRWGRPVYQRVYTRSHCESRPVYYRSSSYSRSYDYGRPYHYSRYSHSRPRVAISFGF